MIGSLPDDDLRRKRVRRVKKLLHPLPRRTNLHKYPIIKYFSKYARKNAEIWSFKRTNITRAIYLGWFIALIPMYGLQMITAFIFSLFFRANCFVAMTIQWTTNPLTIPPILYAQYKLGAFVLKKIFRSVYEPTQNFAELLKESGFESLISELTEFATIKHLALSVLIGGFIISIVCAFITDIIYRFWANRYSKNHTPSIPNIATKK